MRGEPAREPTLAPGFFGKVRTHGDFVGRRLPAEFVARWDQGLQEGMVQARQRFGAQWLELYLNAPVWSFALGAGLYGPNAWAGVLTPGVDRVGRYFPFTIAQAVDGAELARRLADAQAWYDRLVGLALSTLTPEFGLDGFDAALRAEGLSSGDRASMPWRLAIPDAADGGFAALLEQTVAMGHAIWWSDGSPAVAASARISAGAATGSQFASLLDVGMQEWDAVIGVIANAGA
ncbi:type VI secretion system-associated protein TagF [Paraburkholderia sp. HD33-4]|uniref:type VI secretion system-associated protein TagF n=1 Tax=Paraburkholderia sp. HD33-4 TaxID=2883242 RepID=UPI001F3918EC|nr:type VI secretion system-associated protein TagF [Paraburkholderia sp. HD33-4]